MAKTLMEYAEWLQDREMIWPKPPEVEPVKATPSSNVIPGICAVIWDIYGVLLRIADGQLMLDHPQKIRMQIALEKTIKEFNMWNSMSRKPGAPWEYMYQQYTTILEERGMAGTKRRGDLPAVNSTEIWSKLIRRLLQNDYEYDESFFGDPDELSEKVAFFFHSNLQGVEAYDDACSTITAIADSKLTQAALSDAQPFTLVQTLRALSRQATLPPLGRIFDPAVTVMSFQEGVRKPSSSLYELASQRLSDEGIEPAEVLYLSCRHGDDLAHAKRHGFRTVLVAIDKNSLQVDPADLRDAEIKPDRLITQLSQVLEIVGL